MFLYYVLQTEDLLWTVGEDNPDGSFQPSQDFDNPREAQEQADYLEGT